MHSYVIQISAQPIEYRLNEDTLEVGVGTAMDYCYNLDDSNRQSIISDILEIFPAGMFSLGEEENTIVYNGGIEEWIRTQWIPKIHQKTQILSTHNIFKGFNLYEAQRILKNAFETDVLFYLNHTDGQSYTERSTEFVELVNGLEKGAILYVGGLIGYHY